MYPVDNSANGEPFWLHQSFPKHHYNELLQGKLPKATLSTNEYINFQNSPPKVTHLSGKLGTETRPALTAYYSRASAGECSTSHYYSPECPGQAQKPAGKPGKLRTGCPKNLKIYHFSTPGAEIIRPQILLFSNPLALTRAFPSIVSMRCYRKNYQKPPC